MSPDLQAKLIADYPSLFRDINAPITQSCMAFGCECGDGWERLIREFCEACKDDERVYFTQIKEKLGRLCLYHVGTDESLDMEADLWQRSGGVCEECGSEENVSQTEGWITTLCADCMERN